MPSGPLSLAVRTGYFMAPLKGQWQVPRWSVCWKLQRRMDTNRRVTPDSFFVKLPYAETLEEYEALLPWNVNPEKLAINVINTGV